MVEELVLPAVRTGECPLDLFAAIPTSIASGTLTDKQLTVGFVAIVLTSLLGLLLLTAVIIGARYVRRINRRPMPPSQMVSDRWYEKPLVDPAPKSPNDEISDIE